MLLSGRLIFGLVDDVAGYIEKSGKQDGGSSAEDGRRADNRQEIATWRSNDSNFWLNRFVV